MIELTDIDYTAKQKLQNDKSADINYISEIIQRDTKRYCRTLDAEEEVNEH